MPPETENSSMPNNFDSDIGPSTQSPDQPSLQSISEAPFEAYYDTTSATYQEIKAEIERQGGQIPFSDFMRMSEAARQRDHPEAQSEPEVHSRSAESGLYNATLARQMFATWEAMGKPAQFTIAEIGGGTGRLAAGILESIREQYPDFYQALRYVIQGPDDQAVIAQQANVIKPEDSEKVSWQTPEDPLADIEGAIIADGVLNKLVRGLPVERLRQVGSEPQQVYVRLDEAGRLIEVLGDLTEEVRAFVETYKISVSRGTEEVVPLAAAVEQEKVAAALKRGILLAIEHASNDVARVGEGPIIDYSGRGYNPKTQEYEDVSTPDDLDETPALRFPGQIKITAQVSGQVLRQTWQSFGMKRVFSGSQMEFLKRAGLLTILQELGQPQTPSVAERLHRIARYKDQYTQLRSGFDTITSQETGEGDRNVQFYARGLPKFKTLPKAEGPLMMLPMLSNVLRLQIGPPNTQVIIRRPLENDLAARVKEDGCIDLTRFYEYFRNGKGLKILSQNGATLADLTTKAGRDTIFAASGLINDLDPEENS